MLVRIANREDPDQKSDLGLCCSSRPFDKQLLGSLKKKMLIGPDKEIL